MGVGVGVGVGGEWGGREGGGSKITFSDVADQRCIRRASVWCVSLIVSPDDQMPSFKSFLTLYLLTHTLSTLSTLTRIRSPSSDQACIHKRSSAMKFLN